MDACPARLLTPAGVPRTLTGIAVARLRSTTDVIYAVAGDEAVYRFSETGVSDRRIAMDGAGAPR